MKIKSVVYFLLFISNWVVAQTTEDYLYYQKKASDYLHENKMDSAFYYSKISLKGFEKLQNDTLAMKATMLLFQSAKTSNENNHYLYLLEKKIIKCTNPKLSADIYMNLGKHYYNHQNDDVAMKYYLKTDSISSKNNIKNFTTVIALSGIAHIIMYSKTLSDTQNFDKAEDYILRAIQIAETLNNDVAKGIVYEKYANLKSRASNYSEAKKYLNKTLLAAKNAKDTLRESSVYWNLALIQSIEKRNDSAEFYYKKRISILENSTQHKELAVAHVNLGLFYNEQKNYTKAIPYFEKALKMFNHKVDNRKEFEITTLKSLANAYFNSNNPNEAYALLNKATTIKDSLLLYENNKNFLELETKYQTEKKEQAIKLLSAENLLEKRQKYIYISIACALLLLGLFLFINYRNKIKIASKLKELNELKSRFFANISHEFRTPLTLIKSPVQSLQNEISNESQLEKLTLIDKSSNRMLELVNQLLELSKIDSGNLQLVFKKEILQNFIMNCIEPFVFQAKETHKKFVFNIDKNNKSHYLDKDVIEKIITNLLSNAFKYTSENEKISLNATIINEILTIQVSNSGCTLKKEELSKLFERFYQSNEENKGYGIGLALVKELVTLYKGEISATLDNQNILFTATLPLDKNNPNAILVTNDNSNNTSVATEEINSDLPILLILDDNPDIRSLIGSIFKEDYTILLAEDGEKGLKLAQNEIPDCIISDVMMPKMNGFQFTKAIKTNELTSFIPVILLTANTSEETHLESLKNTADAFLTKPFNNNIVKETVSQLIAERKKLQERYSQELILKPTDIIVDSYDEKFINKLQIILDENLSNPDFTAENFANEVNLSRMQLHRKLKSLFGVATTEFIRKERLKLAHQLLQKPNVTVSEVAYAVGFNEVTYFSKCFKEYFSISPSEFQKLH